MPEKELAPLMSIFSVIRPTSISLTILSIWWCRQNPIHVERAPSERLRAIYFFDFAQVQPNPTSPTRSNVCLPQLVHARQTFSPAAFLSNM